MPNTDTVQTSAQTIQHAPPYVHVHCAPDVPSEIEHARQRRYGPDAFNGTRSSIARNTNPGQTVDAGLTVYRDGDEDVAEVVICLQIKHFTASETTLRLTASELREAAGRLLDAAHDLDINPASKLRAAAKQQAKIGGAA